MAHTILSTEDGFDMITEDGAEIILDYIEKINISFNEKVVGVGIQGSSVGIEIKGS